MTRLIYAGLLAAAFYAGSAVAAPRSVWLDHLTWTEARTELGDPQTVVVLAVAGIEARGPHLPLGSRTMVLRQVLERAAGDDGHAIVAPLLTFSPQMTEDAVGALRWPGTLHASPSTLASVIGDILTSLKVHGAQKMVLVSEDPQAMVALRDAADALNALWGAEGVQVVVAENLIEPSRDARLIEAAGLSPEPPQAPGGLLETSEMLACCEDQVRMAHIPRTPSAVQTSGAQGHPARAQARLGAQSITLKAAAIEQAFAQARTVAPRGKGQARQPN